MIGRHVLAGLFRLNTFACGEILEKGDHHKNSKFRSFVLPDGDGDGFFDPR